MISKGAVSARLRRFAAAHAVGVGFVVLVTAATCAVAVYELAAVRIAMLEGDPGAPGFQGAADQIARVIRLITAGAGLVVLALLAETLLAFAPLVRRLRHERAARQRAVGRRRQARSAARAAGARLAESETRFRSSFDSAAIGMALVAFNGRFIEVNRSLADMLGYTEEELTALDVRQLCPAEDADALLVELSKLAGGTSPSYRVEQRYFRKDHAPVWALVAAGTVHDAAGQPLYAVAQIEDITARKRAEENAERYAAELQSLALTDDLTSVYNRRGFRVLAEQVCLAQRRSAEPLMLVALDLDRLKYINDHFGHAAGDRALLIVATALASTFRTSDVIGRLGGDEFICLLPNAADMDEHKVRERLSARLEQLVADLHEEFPVTATVGVAIAPAKSEVDLDALIREADRSMYEAKHARTAGAGEFGGQ